MPQTDYSQSPDIATLGQIAYMGLTEKRSGINKSGAVLAYGRGVKLSPPEGIANLSSGSDMFAGVVARIYQYEDVFDTLGYVGYDLDRDSTYIVKGSIAVEVEEAIQETDLVFCRFAVNGAGKDVIGRFRNDADTNTCLAVPSARWRSRTTGAGIAILEINLP